MDARTIKYLSKFPIDVEEMRIDYFEGKLLDLSAFTKLRKLYCRNNFIKDVILPNSIEELFIDDNHLEAIKLPKNLRVLSISGNFLKSITLPKKLKYLDISHSWDLEEISFNSKLKYLIINGCKIKDIDLMDLEKLVYLDISNNALKTLEKLPRNLKHLNASHSKKLENVDHLPNKIKYLDLSYCEKLGDAYMLPNSIRKISLIGCYKMIKNDMKQYLPKRAEYAFSSSKLKKMNNKSSDGIKSIYNELHYKHFQYNDYDAYFNF